MKNTEILTITFLIVSTLTTACGGTTPEPVQLPEPEISPVPTNTPLPLPTETSIPTNTPLPAGVLFREDFNGMFQPGWHWELEDPSRWSFVEKGDNQWLQIIAQDQRSNVLMRDAPQGDFSIASHVVADPNQNFHQASVFIFEDTDLGQG